MKKQILLGFLMLCLLFPVYGKGNTGKRSAPSTKKTQTNIQRQAKAAAPTQPSTNMIWSPYFFDLSKSENNTHLTAMTTIPKSFTAEEKKIVMDGSVKEKYDLAVSKLQSGKLPSEWFQLGYMLGLYEYFRDVPARAKNMGKERLRFIRFMEMYVLDLYFNRHAEVRKQQNFTKIINYKNALHEFTFADNPNVSKVTVANTNPKTGFTTFFTGESDGGKTDGNSEVELVENNSSNKSKQNNDGGGVGGGKGENPNGNPNGSLNGNPDGSIYGSPYGVPGGTRESGPSWAVPYNSDHVYEFIEKTDDVSTVFFG